VADIIHKEVWRSAFSEPDKGDGGQIPEG